MENLKEFKALKKRYETITIEEIEENWDNSLGWQNAQCLTGFGAPKTCTLCVGVEYNCIECFYTLQTKAICHSVSNYHTFQAIQIAKRPQDLLDAFRDRAKHMQIMLNKIKSNETN